MASVKRPREVLLLALMCVLLVLALGAIESGRLAGVVYGKGLAIPGFNFSWNLNRTQTAQGFPNNSTAVTGTATSENSTTQVFEYQNGGPLASTFAFFSTVPDWLLTTIAIAGFAGVCFLALRLKSDIHVIDFQATLREMEIQQKRLSEAWSSKLRNEALLRYYALMRRACSRVGLQERMTETPQEYIGRASSFLHVDDRQAVSFAVAVNRCRYGEELSADEAGEASVFMSSFTNVIRRKTGGL
jgi:hypothetical protein